MSSTVGPWIIMDLTPWSLIFVCLIWQKLSFYSQMGHDEAKRSQWIMQRSLLPVGVRWKLFVTFTNSEILIRNGIIDEFLRMLFVNFNDLSHHERLFNSALHLQRANKKKFQCIKMLSKRIYVANVQWN